ncbi:lactonase family protein [Isoptericola halotolerans]|uniref:6-phosphogluconolactonase (Cycloisomerase 2 family) n=1 Tax=Isoptericola halotolerans TaxID=300560 RepID=A0ABX2A5R3_9MICO|nr:beta-propeller fold lactonase family protein [Isoptericola halotolerans]NOV97250.1 6-phosphogluconolactonase (cycloisomerase 2 family) [Isoptericola halotolerans]
MTSTSSRTLWIGTYPPGDTPGAGEGVWRVAVDLRSGALGVPELAAEAAAPSFLALHPHVPVLYAVSETAPGRLTALHVADDGGLSTAASSLSGGDDACHVAATPRTVWVANYGDGVAAAFEVADDGVPAADRRAIRAGSGSGPVSDRQEGPHAHQVTVVGDHVLVTDLGGDLIRRYPVDPLPGETSTDDADEDVVAAHLPAGAGPRHLVVLPSGALVVVGELDAHLHVLVPAGDGWEHSGSVPLAPAAVAGEDFGGHVTLSADGTRLHVGVRGSDVLAVHAVSDGAAPQITHLVDVPLGDGAWPRHHEVLATDDGELVVVALQGTGELVTVRLVPGTGAGEVVHRAGWATPPACVLVAR